jgi:hypothetical protein
MGDASDGHEARRDLSEKNIECASSRSSGYRHARRVRDGGDRYPSAETILSKYPPEIFPRNILVRRARRCTVAELEAHPGVASASNVRADNSGTGEPMAVYRLFLAAALFVAVWNAAWPAAAHDWYTGLRNSHAQVCCGGHDCAAVPPEMAREDTDGSIEIRYGQKWLRVPPDNILDITSPDGRMHACIVGGEVRCLILPAML